MAGAALAAGAFDGDRAEWMAQLPGNAKVCDLSLPGTHNSGTGHNTSGLALGNCQSLTIANQFNAGVRAYDFRPHPDNGKLPLKHGITDCNISFEDALNTLIDCLKEHPSEMVFIQMQCENGDGSGDNTFWNLMANKLSEIDENYLIRWRSGLTLDQCRGKVILVSRTKYGEYNGHGDTYWGLIEWGGMDNIAYGQTKIYGGDNADAIVSDLYQYKNNEDKTSAILNALKYAQFKGDNVWANIFVSGYKGSLGISSSYKTNAKLANTAAADYISGLQAPGRLGLVYMDFAGTDSDGLNGAKLTDALIDNTLAWAETIGEQDVEATFNANNVILPSSQWTPDSPYTADIWVVNTGNRFEGAQDRSNPNYNHIWGTPAADAEGRQWYEPDYQPTGKDGNQWVKDAKAPFSSDANYKGHKSYQWVTGDIMGDFYGRRTFTVEAPVEKDIYLACGRDDAPSEWYINGTLVHLDTDGWNNDNYVRLTPAQKALIKTDGTTNVLAFHVHQNWGGAFADCGLYVADMARVINMLDDCRTSTWSCRYNLPANNAALTDLGWTDPDFDDSAWAEAYGPFSNGNDQFRTTYWNSDATPIQLRRTFTLTGDQLDDLNVADAVLSCSYDEYPKVYLNGTLIWSADRWNDNNYAVHTLTPEQKLLFREGRNVLAVSAQQGSGGGHIDLGLKASSEYKPTSGIEEIIAVPAVRPADDRIFNLQGIEVKSPSAPGIYIRGGKKFIVR